MQQKEKPAAAEELAVPAKANPLETFGSLFGTARPRPPSALWPRPPLCSSWPPQRPHATRLLAKKPAATTTLTPVRQPEAAKPTATTKSNALAALGFSFWWRHQAQGYRHAQGQRCHQTHRRGPPSSQLHPLLLPKPGRTRRIPCSPSPSSQWP